MAEVASNSKEQKKVRKGKNKTEDEVLEGGIKAGKGDGKFCSGMTNLDGAGRRGKIRSWGALGRKNYL